MPQAEPLRAALSLQQFKITCWLRHWVFTPALLQDRQAGGLWPLERGKWEQKEEQ